jgi:hypothetical protein
VSGMVLGFFFCIESTSNKFILTPFMGSKNQTTINILLIFVRCMAPYKSLGNSSLASGPRTFVAVTSLFIRAPENIPSCGKSVSMNGQ